MADVPLMNNPMTTDQDIIVAGASGVPARLAAGSEGDVLTIDSGDVAWAAPAGGGGGGLVLVAYTRTAGNYTTTSTTFVDLDATNLSFDLVVPTNGRIHCGWVMAGKNSGNSASNHVDLTVDGTSVSGGLGVTEHWNNTLNFWFNLSGSYTSPTPLSADTYTVRLRVRTSSGTLTLGGGSASSPCLNFWAGVVA